MRTSSPGNEEGFVLLDGVVSLFIAAAFCLMLLGLAATISRTGAASLHRGIDILEAQNAEAERPLGGDDE